MEREVRRKGGCEEEEEREREKERRCEEYPEERTGKNMNFTRGK